MVLDGCVRVSIEIKKKGCGNKGARMVGKKGMEREKRVRQTGDGWKSSWWVDLWQWWVWDGK